MPYIDVAEFRSLQNVLITIDGVQWEKAGYCERPSLYHATSMACVSCDACDHDRLWLASCIRQYFGSPCRFTEGCLHLQLSQGVQDPGLRSTEPKPWALDPLRDAVFRGFCAQSHLAFAWVSLQTTFQSEKDDGTLDSE